jgi:hypothetical protein
MSPVSAIANRTALVFGASGITGWAIVREALTYPTATTFSRVIGLTKRPLDREKSFLPDDSRLTLAHGVDLTASVDDVVAKLAEIDGIKNVTDVYFAGTSPQPPVKLGMIRSGRKLTALQHIFNPLGLRTL